MAAIIRFDFRGWYKEDYYGADARYANHCSVSKYTVQNVRRWHSHWYPLEEYLPKDKPAELGDTHF